MNIGFIGLGAMGKPMALNLVKAGHAVKVYDIMTAAVNELVQAGAKAAPCPRDVASGSDIIITMLPNAAIVEDTFCAAEGLLSGCSAGAVFVDMSSVAPHTSLKMSKLAAAKGAGYVDAPVSGGTAGASGGSLTIMVGGEKEQVEKAMPVLQLLGKNVWHIGGIGTGDAIKMVNNLLLGANMAALAEALVLGVKSGLSAETMLEVISQSSGNSYVLGAKMEKFVMKRNFAPGFTVDLQYKDLELAIESAKAMALPLPVTTVAQQVFEMARAKGLGKEDISALVKLWEEGAKVEVKGKDA